MYSYLLIGAAALAAGSPAPAPAVINLDIINSAAAPSLTGPPVGASVQTGVYDPYAAAISAANAATGVATAIATASEAPSKRDLQERSYCIGSFCISLPSNYQSSGGCTKSASATSAPATSTSSASKTAVTTAPAVTSSASVSTRTVPSTCTPVSWTNTNAFITTDTACPQPYEVGTYCGFINPEDPCAIQPDGNGPQITPDTVAAFQSSSLLHSKALNAVAAKGYAQTFKDLNASVSANSYMGLHTLTSYDVQGCATFCDNTDLCTGFNVYMERDPSWNPEQCSCGGANVTSITNYKCTLWGSGVQAAAATNFGQTRTGGFQTVIVGSNGYEKTNTTTPTTPPGWTNPKNCSGAHDHPRTCMNEKLFKGVFDVNVCATFAGAQNALNAQNSWIAKILSYFGYNPGKCNFFNAFMLTQNGKAAGTYCKLFSEQYDPTYGNTIPGWNQGSYWGVESSWSFCSSS